MLSKIKSIIKKYFNKLLIFYNQKIYLNRLKNRARNKKNKRIAASFYTQGFHGDQFLIDIINFIIGNKNISNFIETGSNVGSTLAYLAKKYPHINCLSCEPDENAFQEAKKNTKTLDNVTIYKKLSQEFIYEIKKNHPSIFNQKNLFWLDAHGYGFVWPLKEEIEFILNNFSNAYIFIDDFKVPHLEAFKYDSYDKQICSFDYIKDAVPDIPYKLYYPNYTQKTSNHHPLKGWGLFVIGEEDTFKYYHKSQHIIASTKLHKLN